MKSCAALGVVIAAICDVATSVAEVIANQPNQQGHIISLTYAAESQAALRASVTGTYFPGSSSSHYLPLSSLSSKHCLKSSGVAISHPSRFLLAEDGGQRREGKTQARVRLPSERGPLD